MSHGPIMYCYKCYLGSSIVATTSIPADGSCSVNDQMIYVLLYYKAVCQKLCQRRLSSIVWSIFKALLKKKSSDARWIEAQLNRPRCSQLCRKDQ